MGKASRIKRENKLKEFFLENFRDETGMTMSLYKLISNYKKSSQDQYNKLREYIVTTMPAQIKHLQEKTPGAERARYVHSEIDKTVTEERKRYARELDITCRKGCSFCCHLMVDVTDDEAELLAQRVRDGVVINRERLAEQASWKNDPKEWYRRPYAETACVFLGEGGLCSVYEDRPSGCRLLLSVDDPKMCDREAGNDAHKQYACVPAEVISSSCLSTMESGTLPMMLSKKLEVAK